MKDKLPFWAFYIGNPGLNQKLKVPKWVCRSTLASACNEPTLFAIFGPARGQIFGKTAEKIYKIDEKLHFLGLFGAKRGLTQKLKVPKWVCRSALASFCNGPPFFAIFGPARGQIFGKTAEKIVKK